MRNIQKQPNTASQELRDIFEALGLNNKDLRVYKALIGLNQATSAQVANIISLPRQTIHSILLKLKGTGLVSLSSRSGVQLFIADPEMLKIVMKEKQDNFSKLQNTANTIIPKLKLQHKSHVRRPTVKYYDGVFGLQHLFDSMIEYYSQPGSVKEYRGYGINTHDKTSIQKYLSKFIQKRARLGVITKLLLGSGTESFTKGKAKRLNILMKHTGFDAQNSSLYILNDRVYLFSFDDNAGLIIENRALANLLKNIFEDHWKRID